MIRETVEGRPVFLRRTRDGWAVKWGRTIISNHSDPIQAVKEIIELFRGDE